VRSDMPRAAAVDLTLNDAPVGASWATKTGIRWPLAAAHSLAATAARNVSTTATSPAVIVPNRRRRLAPAATNAPTASRASGEMMTPTPEPTGSAATGGRSATGQPRIGGARLDHRRSTARAGHLDEQVATSAPRHMTAAGEARTAAPRPMGHWIRLRRLLGVEGHRSGHQNPPTRWPVLGGEDSGRSK